MVDITAEWQKYGNIPLCHNCRWFLMWEETGRQLHDDGMSNWNQNSNLIMRIFGKSIYFYSSMCKYFSLSRSFAGRKKCADNNLSSGKLCTRCCWHTQKRSLNIFELKTNQCARIEFRRWSLELRHIWHSSRSAAVSADALFSIKPNYMRSSELNSHKIHQTSNSSHMLRKKRSLLHS